MTHTVEYNPAAHAVESHFHGETDLNELKETAQETMRIVKEMNCFNILTDLSHAHLHASVLELYDHPEQLVHIIEEEGLHVQALKRAFVVRENAERFKFYEDVAVNRGHKVKLFKEIEEARKWLQQS